MIFGSVQNWNLPQSRAIFTGNFLINQYFLWVIRFQTNPLDSGVSTIQKIGFNFLFCFRKEHPEKPVTKRCSVEPEILCGTFHPG